MDEFDPPRWRRLVEEAGDVKLEPVFSAVEPEKLRDLQEQAARRDPSYRAEPLDRFYYVDVPKAKDLEAVAKQLREWASVSSVEIEVVGPDPLVNFLDDPRATNQDNLDAAPTGIDARYAWTLAGGDGAGQRVVDMERGWTFNHEDLSAHGITLINGAVLDTSRAHGTSVFGAMIASDNTVGCVGIAERGVGPGVLVHDQHDSECDHRGHPRHGLRRRVDLGGQVNVATSGDPQYGPVETIEANYEAIRLATALGMIVVEAGGNATNNGGTPAVNLDTWQNAAGKKVLWRSPANADFRDSGAAPALQGVCQANQQIRLSPRQMRTLLSDPVTNTPPSPAEATARTAAALRPRLQGRPQDREGR